MFWQLSPQNLILIGTLSIIFATLNLAVLIFLKKKEKEKTQKISSHSQIIFPQSPFFTVSVSEKFQKDLEALILNQTLHNLSVAKEKILKDAEKIAQLYQDEVQRIISDLKIKKQTIENEVESLLENLSEELKAEKNILSQKGTQKIEEEIKNLFLVLKEDLKKAFSKYEEEVIKEINLAKKEIQDYKNLKKKEIDEKFYETLNQLTKSILGRVIDVSTHEDLVLKCLEKAKREGFFD